MAHFVEDTIRIKRFENIQEFAIDAGFKFDDHEGIAGWVAVYYPDLNFPCWEGVFKDYSAYVDGAFTEEEAVESLVAELNDSGRIFISYAYIVDDNRKIELY